MLNLGFTTKTNHLGLGLSTARFLLESVGGTLDCNSEAGHGAEFTVTLPVEIRGRIHEQRVNH